MQEALPTKTLHWPLLGLAALFLFSGARKVARAVPRWWPEAMPYAMSRAWEANAPAWVRPIIYRAANATGVPAALLAALVRTESAWQPKVVSSAGAIGLAQLMPATAQQLGVTDPFDPEQNVMGGARYLREQLERFGSVKLALAAYNAGPHRVVQYGGIPPFKETQAYVKKIWDRFTGAV
jgi:soluble lytic murein transglycosylase-like protein